MQYSIVRSKKMILVNTDDIFQKNLSPADGTKSHMHNLYIHNKAAFWLKKKELHFFF